MKSKIKKWEKIVEKLKKVLNFKKMNKKYEYRR